MTAKEKVLWNQVAQILRQNVVTTEHPDREKQVLVKARERAVWQRRAA